MMRVVTVILGALLAGCSGPPRPFPAAAEDGHRISARAIETARRDQEADVNAATAALAQRVSSARPLQVLALSSGGQNGAFGAGLIEGWGARGTRPEFDLVTGASTGALIAVFAFLGDDATLRTMYTTYETSDAYTPYPWISVLNSNAYAASTPLRTTIARSITPHLVRAIAREAAQHRVLLISTANLDLNVMRVWNMTALAADESRSIEERTDRFRNIVVASLSIPSLVPPVFLDGCMHADGGVLRQVFVADPGHEGALARSLKAPDGPGPDIWVIINRRLGSPARAVRNQIIPIASRSLQMMIDAALSRDVADMERFAASCGGTFRLASLPYDASRREPQGFLDHAYMMEVHALGHRLAGDEATWSRSSAPREEPSR